MRNSVVFFLKVFLCVFFYLSFLLDNNVNAEFDDKKSYNSDIELKIGGFVDFSGYYAKNLDEFYIGRGAPYVKSLVKSGGLVVGADYGSDGGVIGDYTSEYGFDNNIGFSLSAENRLKDNLSYGAKVDLFVDTYKFMSIRARSAYLFVNIDDSIMELGSMDSVVQRMKLDISNISSVHGEFNNDWFKYGNVEGSYVNAFYNLSVPALSSRERGVRRPFYVLPMLYSEYLYKFGPNWNNLVKSSAEFTADDPHIDVYGRTSLPKISYYHSFVDYGISLGITYAYEGGYFDDRDRPKESRASYRNICGVGVNYEGAIDNLKFKISAVGERGDYVDNFTNSLYSKTDTQYTYHDLIGWNIGGMAGYAGMKFVASYANLYQSGLSKELLLDVKLDSVAPSNPVSVNPGDTTYFTFGAAYEDGPAMLSLGYFRSSTSPVDRYSKNILTNYSISSHYNLSGNKNRLTPYVSLNYFVTDEVFDSGNFVNGMEPVNNIGYVIIGGVLMQF